MVQVDVREKDGVEFAQPDAASPELLAQGLQRGAWSGIDNGQVAVRFQKAGSYGARPPHPEIVECVDRVHKKTSVAQDGKVDSPQQRAVGTKVAAPHDPCPASGRSRNQEGRQ